MKESDIIYSFVAHVEREVEESKESIDEKTGDKTTVTKKVNKKIPFNFRIIAPNTKQVKQAKREYSKVLSSCIKDGILTKDMILKKYIDSGGIETQQEAKLIRDHKSKISDLQVEFVDLSIRKDKLDEEEKQRYKEVISSLNNIKEEIIKIEQKYSHIFENCADMEATSHVILWYTTALLEIENQNDEKEAKKKWEPFFKGESFEIKENSYYELEDDPTDIWLAVRHKVTYFISFWYNGAAIDKKDFEKLEKQIDSGKYN